MILHKNIYFYTLLCISTHLLGEPYFKQFFIGNQQIAYAQGDTETGLYILHIQIQPEYANLIQFSHDKEKQSFNALLKTIKAIRRNPQHAIYESDEEIEETLSNAFALFCKQRNSAQLYSYRLSNGAHGHVFFLFTHPKNEPDDSSDIDKIMQQNITNWSTPQVEIQASIKSTHPAENQDLPRDFDEDSDYWEAQKKHLIKELDYCGEIPEELQRYVAMINNPELYKQLGVYKSSGFIFHGPPGTGKTFLASIFAQKIKSDFMYVKGDDLMDKYQASGLSKPAEFFEKARKRRDKTGGRITIFLDEIDTIVNGDGQHEGTQQLIGSLLKEVGSEVNHDIFVVAATNKFNSLNKALLRSGRFEHHVEFTLPDIHERKKLLDFFKKPYASDFANDIDWNNISEKTVGFSPADLQKMMTAAKISTAIRRTQKPENWDSIKVTTEDFDTAFAQQSKPLFDEQAHTELWHLLESASLATIDIIAMYCTKFVVTPESQNKLMNDVKAKLVFETMRHLLYVTKALSTNQYRAIKAAAKKAKKLDAFKTNSDELDQSIMKINKPDHNLSHPDTPTVPAKPQGLL